MAGEYRAAYEASCEVGEHEYSRLNGGGGRRRAKECDENRRARQLAEVALLRAARGA